MKVLQMRTDKMGTSIKRLGACLSGYANGYEMYEWETENLKPHTEYALNIIEIPAGYRLANENDKRYPKPEGYMCIVDLKVGFVKSTDVGGLNWLPYAIYIVPIKKRTDIKRKQIQTEISEAQHKLEQAQAKLKELN